MGGGIRYWLHPGLRLFHGLFHIIISNNIYVISEKTESWRGYVIYPRPQSWQVASSGYDSRFVRCQNPPSHSFNSFHYTLLLLWCLWWEIKCKRVKTSEEQRRNVDEIWQLLHFYLVPELKNGLLKDSKSVIHTQPVTTAFGNQGCTSTS